MYTVILHGPYFHTDNHTRAVCVLLLVTYKHIWEQLNKIAPKKIISYWLQAAALVKSAASNRKKGRGASSASFA